MNWTPINRTALGVVLRIHPSEQGQTYFGPVPSHPTCNPPESPFRGRTKQPQPQRVRISQHVFWLGMPTDCLFTIPLSSFKGGSHDTNRLSLGPKFRNLAHTLRLSFPFGTKISGVPNPPELGGFRRGADLRSTWWTLCSGDWATTWPRCRKTRSRSAAAGWCLGYSAPPLGLRFFFPFSRSVCI